MPQQPNILLLCFDQMGAHCLSVYGNKMVQTPNLDRLAARGVVFDHCVTTSPVCGPARASIMTGLYPSQHGVWTNDIPPAPGTTSFAQVVAAQGYRTSSIGKMHFTPGGEPWGFTHQARTEDLGRASPKTDGYLLWLAQQGIKYKAFRDGDPSESGLPLEQHQDYWVASESSKFIQDNRDQPFCLFASFIGPHDPVNPPAPYHKQYDWHDIDPPIRPDAEKAGKASVHLQHTYGWHGLKNGLRVDRSDEDQQKYTALYYGAISFLDAQVGRVLEALDAAGIADNTYIVFTTDHGHMLGNHWLQEKGPWGYEESLRVPLFISGPGIPKGQRSSALANHIDLAPTFAQWAGGETFGQGISLAKVCKDPEQSLLRTVTVSEFNETAKLLRDERWTFCYYPGTRERELYDRKADPLQQDNLAGRPDFAEIENRFLRELVEFEIQQKPFRMEAKDLSPQCVAGLYQYRAKQVLKREDLHSLAAGCDVDDILSWFSAGR